MYPPKHYQTNSIKAMELLIKSYPLATIISTENDTPIISHIPLIYRKNVLTGHLDRNNPHLKLLTNNKPVTILFNGPESYISPSIFKTEHLPTWNYAKVHLQGTVQQIDDVNALKTSLIDMTEYLEAPENNYILKGDNPRMDANLNYISLFEISITHWEGKFKLSNDKPKKEILIAKKAMEHSIINRCKIFLSSLLKLQ